jgi:hypothetical protein
MNALHAVLPLRSLPASRAWLWLARPEAGDTAAALGLLLLHGVPGLLDTLGREVFRLG